MLHKIKIKIKRRPRLSTTEQSRSWRSWKRDGRPVRRYVGTGALGEVPGGLQTGQNVGLELPFLETRVDDEALKTNRDTWSLQMARG